MLALGYSAFIAVALPAIGYDALCTYALLGVPVVVFADVVHAISGRAFAPAEIGLYFARYMPVVTSLIALSMLWLVGGWKEIRRGWHIALLTGLTAGAVAIGMNYAGLPTLTGIVAGLAVIGVMLGYLRMTGGTIRGRSKLTDDDLRSEREMSLGRATLPWILLIVASVITNFRPLGVYDTIFTRWSMPVEIVPGRPERLRVLWQAYTWVLIATLVSIPIYRMTRRQLSGVWRKTVRRVPRPSFAAGVFFAIAFLLNHSGKSAEWTLSPEGTNMVKAVADASASLFGSAYVGVAGFLGLLGGFISGSETSSIAMLSKLHFDTLATIFAGRSAEDLLAISLLVAAASGIGGGLASVISPAKLQNASAVIDRIGLESQVIRSTVWIALWMVSAVALMTFLFLVLGV
jgi:lactate permease